MWLILRNQGLIVWVIVILMALITAAQVIRDTRSPSKTAAYLLLIILLPIGGPIIYFLVGINYRKRKIYSKKLIKNEALFNQLRERVLEESEKVKIKHKEITRGSGPLIDLLLGESLAPLSENKVTVLQNGEEKFPALLKVLEQAKSFIHIEYYIFDNDNIGKQVKNILINKAREGVKIRIIFDDFGSHDLWDTAVDELRKSGVQIFPFYRIHFILLANRLNYRDHRKVVIVDGNVGFIGGINIADRYINGQSDLPFWRDTHLKIEGRAVQTLQYHFLSNWNFCAGESLSVEPLLFPALSTNPDHNDMVQIVTSGPDYPWQSIMLSYLTAINSAKRSVYITTPYFIPNESIVNCIKAAALSGKDVRLLLPEKSDSVLVDAASRFYFEDLLEAGVKIYLYTNGFIHAKTLVADNHLSMVGTANMDLRSFELNFEINAVVYSERVNDVLTQSFMRDLENSKILTREEWRERSNFNSFLQALARIFAPLL